MPVFIDQMQREVEITKQPQRIISLVPSQTELLYDLGLENKVIGITKFCIHPQHWLKQKTIVGGTKQLNHKKIASLNPDLIIGNKEENSKEDLEILMQKYPVWMSDISTLEDAFSMIENLAQITNTEISGKQLLEKIKTEFHQLPAQGKPTKRIAYFIWNKPMMVAGKDTFINCMIEKMGFENVFANEIKSIQQSYRYPQITALELQQGQPDCIFLSSEPFPFKEKHISQFQTICPKAEIKVVDGEMFSWYGSRLKSAPAYFKTLLK